MDKKERKELYTAFEQFLNDKNHEVLADDEEIRDLGENMKLLSKSICGWWKPMVLTSSLKTGIFYNCLMLRFL